MENSFFKFSVKAEPELAWVVRAAADLKGSRAASLGKLSIEKYDGRLMAVATDAHRIHVLTTNYLPLPEGTYQLDKVTKAEIHLHVAGDQSFPAWQRVLPEWTGNPSMTIEFGVTQYESNPWRVAAKFQAQFAQYVEIPESPSYRGKRVACIDPHYLVDLAPGKAWPKDKITGPFTWQVEPGAGTTCLRARSTVPAAGAPVVYEAALMPMEPVSAVGEPKAKAKAA